MKSGSESDGYGIHWYDTVDSTQWMIKLYNAKYRSNAFNSVSQVLFATTTQFINMPTNDFSSLYFYLEGDDSSLVCSNTNCFFYGACSAQTVKLNPVTFSFDETWDFELTSSEYMVDTVALGYNICLLLFQGQGTLSDYYIIGDVFLKQYYSIYSFSNNSIGLAVNVESSNTLNTEKMQPGPIAFMVFIGLQAGVFIAIGVYLSVTQLKVNKRLGIGPVVDE